MTPTGKPIGLRSSSVPDLSAGGPAPGFTDYFRRRRDRMIGQSALLLSAALGVQLYVTGYAHVLNFLYPAGALVAGYWLYRNLPAAYTGFVWGLVFFTPFLRRLVDFQAGWNPLNPIMLAPLTVAGLSALSMIRNASALWRGSLWPFGLALVSLIPAYAVGALRVGPFSATFDLLQWAAPIVFGAGLAVSKHNHAEIGRVISQVFVVGACLMGVYGIVQFYVAPPWDAYWMTHVDMNSIGTPYPFLVRVFSTMNAPGPFAQVIFAGLLLPVAQRGWLAWLAVLPGYGAFLLSLVRAAWLGWFIAVAALLTSLASAHRRVLVRRLVLGVLLAVTTGAAVPSLRNVIVERFGTFTQLGEDHSLEERTDFTHAIVEITLGSPLGRGIGSTGTSTKLSSGEATVFDNGLMNVPYVLGWMGGTLYFLAVGALMVAAFRRGRRSSPMAMTSAAIALGAVAQLVSGNNLVGITGFVFWGFAGFVLAHPTSSD